MHDLYRFLLQHDATLLQVIAENWGIILREVSQRQAAEQIAHAILAADLPGEIADLTADEQAAIRALANGDGRMQAAPFLRQFGPIRPFGPGRLMRERPWLQPASPAEALWYRALIFSGFEQTAMGGQEFFYLPQEILVAVPRPDATHTTIQLELAPDQHDLVTKSLVYNAVDDTCTMLAFLQQTQITLHPQPELPKDPLLPYLRYKDHARLQMLWTLTLEKGLVTLNGQVARPHTMAAQAWLQAPRVDQVTTLARAWLTSNKWNDLWQVPTLQPDPSGWQNDPHLPRQLMLEIIAELPPDQWWQLTSLPTAVKQVRPDFQRTGGEYGAWYLRAGAGGEYLLGFEHWDQVEGALLTFLVTGPLFWLGLVELGAAKGAAPVAFRPTAAGIAFAHGEQLPPPAGPLEPSIQVLADGTINVPVATNRLTRFQVARLTDWEPLTSPSSTTYHYRLTPQSLTRAKQAGILAPRVLSWLETANERPLPRPVREALLAWERDGTQVRLRRLTILQVRNSAVLDRLRAAPQLRPLLGESLGPQTIAVQTEDWSRLIKLIAEMGLLCEIEN